MLSGRKLENLLITILTALVAFAVSFLKDLSQSVEQLNRQIVVVIERIARNDAQSSDHEARLRKIERRYER